MSASIPKALPAVAVLAAIAGCKKDPTVLEPFNAEDDMVEVYVGHEAFVDDPDCDAGVACADVHSLVEGAVIGSITVEPGGGPVGTTHRLLVVIGDEWEDRIDRVTTRVDSDRGTGEFELDRDRANPGAWGLSLESMGGRNEERVDTWTILLWEAVPKNEAAATEEGG